MKLLSVFALIAGTMVVTTEAIKLRALEGEGTAPAPDTGDGAADDTADNPADNTGDDTGDNGADEPTEPTVEEFVD